MQTLLRRVRSRLRSNDALRKVVFRARTIGFSRQSRSLEKARKLIEDGNFNRAATCLEHVEVKSGRAWKMLLSCYFTAHRFEDVVSTYAAMPQGSQEDISCRHFHLLASANLKRLDVVSQAIEKVLKGSDSLEAAEFLSKVRSFEGAVDPELRKTMLERIVSHAPALSLEHFDIILKCAHDLRENGLHAESQQLERSLRRAAGGSARNRLRLDIFDAQIHFWDKRYDLQLASINRVLTKQKVDPVTLRNGSAPLSCENLQSKSEIRPQIRGPLVSILMPAYNSAQTIGYALGSLLDQTYQDIEVIVVDDASQDGTDAVVLGISAVDPRVRLIRLNENSGAFVARNTALAAATGEYVTNQDADDWAHPQKIEIAIAELQRVPSIIATWVDHVRCSSQRGFRALSGYFRPDASSLMYRRQPVMERIGWYDSVRAAGDGEFHLRMERSFGHHSIRRIDKLLSFVSWSEATLSGGGIFHIDSDLGLFSPIRSDYRRSFGLWHETADRLYMPFPLNERPFPAPKSLLASKCVG